MAIVRRQQHEVGFVDLVSQVMAETKADEATAKASILELNFEGRLGIDLDWSVHLLPVDSAAEGQVESQVAVA